MADNYTKKITLELKLDKDNKEKIVDEIKKLGENIEISETSKRMMSSIKKFKDEGKQLIQQELKKVLNWALDSLKNLFIDAWDELKTMLDYSRLSNPQTRELAFTYGFSASQAYGYSNAMSALGFSSEEDLFYATNQEIELFKNAFNKYSEKYQKLYDEGTFKKMLEYQVEMNEFQQDLKLEVADFFMQNKELIKKSLSAIMKITELLMKVASWLFGSSEQTKADAVSNAISNYSTAKTTNVSIDNTFNGVDASQRQQLLRLGTYTTEQLIAALR